MPMHAATTFTMDSVASVKIATDPVRKYAMYLMIRRVKPRTTMIFWNSKFSSAALAMAHPNYCLFKTVVN